MAQPDPIRRRSPDEVRERVLSAARVCFRRNGVMATRMDEIADEAQLLRPNLYRYFASREALIASALEREIEITNGIRREKIPLDGPVAAVLVESLVLGYEIHRAEEMTQLVVVKEMIEITSSIVAGDELIMAAESDYWYPVLAYGRSRGEINDRLSDERIIRWFLASQVQLSTRNELFDNVARDAREFFADFIVPPVLSRP
ncbi:TetR/AcrR family transcriptional regulator [Mycobacterium sp.]|uniref:TetR/AcrR family transcriptional regulator n=1 Tax=Mycobacterium sp. TaxID=1785 RepID=UPI0025FDC955|nr:TetR/AcrR family transcriptional regulator [Mycobacterium sp.]